MTTLTVGARVVGRPNSLPWRREGSIFGFAILQGRQVAYICWDGLHPDTDYEPQKLWRDTLPVSAVRRVA